MIVQNLSSQKPFITKDGSQIRSILDLTNAPVLNQSLAEATLKPAGSTQRHYHKRSEEIYFVLEGSGEMEVNGVTQVIHPGDAVLIPPGAWHELRAESEMRFLCCCAPPYAHDDTYFA